MIDVKDQLKIVAIFQELIDGIAESANGLSLQEIAEKSKPLTMELFFGNMAEYLYFIVAQRVTTSFSTRLGGVIEKISHILVTSQGGRIVAGKPNPFDLKFVHPDGIEYWVEIKSINAQNSSNQITISRLKELAESNQCVFRLCIYNDDKPHAEKYKLNAYEFWKLVGGYEQAGADIMAMLSGLAGTIRLKNIVDQRVASLIEESLSNPSWHNR
jgi:hypothetical protein